MWARTSRESCPSVGSKTHHPFSITSTRTHVHIHSMRIRVDPAMPYAHFTLPTTWHPNHTLLVRTPFDEMSVYVRDARTGADLAYPPLHAHHVHVNTDFHWFEVHGDYYPDEYTRRTPRGTSIAMHSAPVVEGVLNLVPQWAWHGFDLHVRLSFRRAPAAARPISKMWFQADLDDDRQCWARYTAPNVASYSVWRGAFAASGTFLSGWVHTHRARSKSIFLFRDDLPELLVDDADGLVPIADGSRFGAVKDVSRLEAHARNRPGLLCHEVHHGPSDVSVVVNGTAYDRHGRLSCAPGFRFAKGDRWSMLIVHFPMFHRDVTVLQHSNIFMYVDLDDEAHAGRVILNSGEFAMVRAVV